MMDVRYEFTDKQMSAICLCSDHRDRYRVRINTENRVGVYDNEEQKYICSLGFMSVALLAKIFAYMDVTMSRECEIK